MRSYYHPGKGLGGMGSDRKSLCTVLVSCYELLAAAENTIKTGSLHFKKSFQVTTPYLNIG
jgi:hypothetical protein